MHWFLSPHLDDAILSCGGLIHQLTQQGETVVIQTFMAGDPPHPLPQTPLIQALHARWGVGESPMAARRAEDQEAARLMGAKTIHEAYPDCPYRTDSQGHPLYPTNDSLFGEIHPDDPLWAISLTVPPETQAIYAPLGAGEHVDHKLISALAQQLAKNSSVAFFFYEEYPYSATSGEGARIVSNPTLQLVGSAALQAALGRITPTQSLTPHSIRLQAADITAKVQAIACYASQISTFWADRDDMDIKVHAYAQELDMAERLWKRL